MKKSYEVVLTVREARVRESKGTIETLLIGEGYGKKEAKKVYKKVDKHILKMMK